MFVEDWMYMTTLRRSFIKCEASLKNTPVIRKQFLNRIRDKNSVIAASTTIATTPILNYGILRKKLIGCFHKPIANPISVKKLIIIAMLFIDCGQQRTISIKTMPRHKAANEHTQNVR
jgi:hypothetical protein